MFRGTQESDNAGKERARSRRLARELKEFGVVDGGRRLFDALVTSLSYYVGQEALLICRTKTRCHHPLTVSKVFCSRG